MRLVRVFPHAVPARSAVHRKWSCTLRSSEGPALERGKVVRVQADPPNCPQPPAPGSPCRVSVQGGDSDVARHVTPGRRATKAPLPPRGGGSGAAPTSPLPRPASSGLLHFLPAASPSLRLNLASKLPARGPGAALPGLGLVAPSERNSPRLGSETRLTVLEAGGWECGGGACGRLVGSLGKSQGDLFGAQEFQKGDVQALHLPRFIRAPKGSGELTGTCNGPSDGVKQCAQVTGNVGVRGQGCGWPSNPGLPLSWESPDPCLTRVLLEPPGAYCAGLALGCAPEPSSRLPSPGTTAALLLDDNHFRVIPWVPVAGPTPVLDRPSQPPGAGS